MSERACFEISRADAHGSARDCLSRAFARVRIKTATSVIERRHVRSRRQDRWHRADRHVAARASCRPAATRRRGFATIPRH